MSKILFLEQFLVVLGPLLHPARPSSLLRSRFLGSHATLPQRGGALRDIPKNGRGGDYPPPPPPGFWIQFKFLVVHDRRYNFAMLSCRWQIEY